MSEIEEPPTKMSKLDTIDDDITDTSIEDSLEAMNDIAPETDTLVSAIPDELSQVDMPVIALSEDKANTLELTGLPEITSLPEITILPELNSGDSSTEANNKSGTESSLTLEEGTDFGKDNTSVMAEEHLQDSDLAEPLQDNVMVEEHLQESTEMIEERLQDSEMVEERLQDNEMVDERLQDNEMVEERLQDSVMVEERLQESLGSQETQDSQGSHHEEWLSEEGLTDDDFIIRTVAANKATETPQPKTNGVPVAAATNVHPSKQEIRSKPVEQNIEDALNSLEGGMEILDQFIVKKPDAIPNVADAKTENGKENDDGNDTDDLLRLLGGEESKTKKLTKTVKDLRSAKKAALTSSDEESDTQKVTVKKLKLAKSLTKKQPNKAVTQDSDGTSDEASTMQKMFGSKKVQVQNSVKHPQSKPNTGPAERPKKDNKLVTSTPLRAPATRSLLKPASVNTPRAVAALPKTNYTSVQVKREPYPNTYSRLDRAVPKRPQPPAGPLRPPRVNRPAPHGPRPDDAEGHSMEDEDHLIEEEFESDEELTSKRRKVSLKSDLEGLSDADSRSEDGSLYDELPSSDSEDIDDWFQLDIRAEKAGDYLPLLGTNAKEVLLEEKNRVAERLSNLKKSLSALTESGKKQAEQVRTATLTLAELDDMLKA